MNGKRAKALRRHARFIASVNNAPDWWKMFYKRLKRKYKAEYRG